MSSQKVQSVSHQLPSFSPHPPIHTYCRASMIRWQVPGRGHPRNAPDSREINLLPKRMQIHDVYCSSVTSCSSWHPLSMLLRVQRPTCRCRRVKRTNTHRGFVDWRGRHSMKQTRSNFRVLNRSTVSIDRCVACATSLTVIVWSTLISPVVPDSAGDILLQNSSCSVRYLLILSCRLHLLFLQVFA